MQRDFALAADALTMAAVGSVIAGFETKSVEPAQL